MKKPVDKIETGSSKSDAVSTLPRGKQYFKQRDQCLNDFDRAYFSELLTETLGNVTLAARRIGIARQNLNKKLRKIGIDPKEFRPKE